MYLVKSKLFWFLLFSSVVVFAFLCNTFFKNENVFEDIAFLLSSTFFIFTITFAWHIFKIQKNETNESYKKLEEANEKIKEAIELMNKTYDIIEMQGIKIKNIEKGMFEKPDELKNKAEKQVEIDIKLSENYNTFK